MKMLDPENDEYIGILLGDTTIGVLRVSDLVRISHRLHETAKFLDDNEREWGETMERVDVTLFEARRELNRWGDQRAPSATSAGASLR